MTSKKTKEKRKKGGGAIMSEEMWNKHVHGIEPKKHIRPENWDSMTEEEKLMARPVDDPENTSPAFYLNFGEFKGLFEAWSWDGIQGKSVIILKTDRERFASDTECKDFLFETMKIPNDPQATMKLTGDYFFVNFHFETL